MYNKILSQFNLTLLDKFCKEFKDNRGIISVNRNYDEGIIDNIRDEDNIIWIITEFCEGGDLYDFIVNAPNSKLPLYIIIILFYCMQKAKYNKK